MEIGNLAEVEAWQGFLSQGKHRCVIQEASEGASTKGKPRLELTLVGTDADSQPGHVIKDWVPVTAESYGGLKAFLEACNYPIPQGNFQLDLNGIRGKIVDVLIAPEENPENKKTYERVQTYSRP
jgi:hypothetical protein